MPPAIVSPSFPGPMTRTLESRRFDLVKLLVEHGYDPAAVDLREVFDTWDPDLMENFIDRGADAETGRPLAYALCHRIRTALRVCCGQVPIRSPQVWTTGTTTRTRSGTAAVPWPRRPCMTTSRSSISNRSDCTPSTHLPSRSIRELTPLSRTPHPVHSGSRMSVHELPSCTVSSPRPRNVARRVRGWYN